MSDEMRDSVIPPPAAFTAPSTDGITSSSSSLASGSSSLASNGLPYGGPVDYSGPEYVAPKPPARKVARARRAVATIPPTKAFTAVPGILVVEDDPDLQWKLARTLTVRGNRVVGASSAEAGLELMKQWPVDLVVVDDKLQTDHSTEPTMSGVDLAMRIRDEYPEVPVVLLVSDGRVGRSVVTEAGDSGAVAVIQKPFQPQELVQLVRSALKQLP